MPGETLGNMAGGRRRRADGARLRRAALQLFSERGFEAVTVGDIALAAGLAPRAFFCHFAGKADVLLSLDGEDGDLLQRVLAWTHLRAG